MLDGLAMPLLVLWAIGLITSFTAGGLLHILLVAAVVVLVFQRISGRRVQRRRTCAPAGAGVVAPQGSGMPTG